MLGSRGVAPARAPCSKNRRTRTTNIQNAAQRLPENERISLDQGGRGFIEPRLVGVAQVVDHFGDFIVTLERIDLHRARKH